MALGFIESDTELTTGNGSYSTLTRFTAFIASCSVFAITTATGSPKYLTLSLAIGGLSSIIEPLSTGK